RSAPRSTLSDPGTRPRSRVSAPEVEESRARIAPRGTSGLRRPRTRSGITPMLRGRAAGEHRGIRDFRLERGSCYKKPVTRLGREAVRLLRGLVAGVVAVVGGATLLGLLDRLSWVFETADVFRLQYLVVLVAAALAGVPLRRPRLAASAAALAAVNFA